MKTSISMSILLVMLLSGCYRAVQISLSQSGMAPCPDSPNCVSSLSENTRHKIEPFPLHISAGQSLNTLRQIIASMERTEILWMSDRSLLATFTTKMGFVDDVQFLIDESRRVIHVRSASRDGYWDLGVNRRRIETMRAEYQRRIQDHQDRERKR